MVFNLLGHPKRELTGLELLSRLNTHPLPRNKNTPDAPAHIKTSAMDRDPSHETRVKEQAAAQSDHSLLPGPVEHKTDFAAKILEEEAEQKLGVTAWRK